MKRIAGYLLAITALITCPCHLVLASPLALSFFGGTALGVAFEAHTGLLIAAATVYFIAALGSGLYLLNRRSEKEARCLSPLSERNPRTPAISMGQASHESRERVIRK